VVPWQGCSLVQLGLADGAGGSRLDGGQVCTDAVCQALKRWQVAALHIVKPCMERSQVTGSDQRPELLKECI
jgi:hypothetical protein